MPFTHPDNITVLSGRYRQDFSCVQARAEDIKKVGQFVPILVRKENDQLILIDGECRLRACKELNREVWYTTHEDGKLQVDSEFQHRLIEMMSNCSRQDMTPVEKSQAIADIDRLMKESCGQKGQNISKEERPDTDSEGHSSEDTAKMLGYKNRRTVITANLIAKAAITMPELSEATTISEAVKMIQTKVRLEAQEELAKRNTGKQQGPIQNPQEYFNKRIILGDCLSGMKSLDPGIASIFLTDPPFGVNLDDHNKVDIETKKGGLSRKIMGTYSDNPEEVVQLLDAIIEQMARVGRPNCFAYMFCAFTHWHHLRETFIANGFNVYHSPMYWIRGSLSLGRIHQGSRCTAPAKWPMKCVYCIIFASRGNTDLAKQGQPDCIMVDPVNPNSKIHSLQLPIPLLTELISRVYHPNTKGLLIDPFAGSGSSLAAAMHFKGLSYFGYELDPENRKRAVSYLINEYDRMINPQPETEIEDLEV